MKVFTSLKRSPDEILLVEVRELRSDERLKGMEDDKLHGRRRFTQRTTTRARSASDLNGTIHDRHVAPRRSAVNLLKNRSILRWSRHLRDDTMLISVADMLSVN